MTVNFLNVNTTPPEILHLFQRCCFCRNCNHNLDFCTKLNKKIDVYDDGEDCKHFKSTKMPSSELLSSFH